MAYTLPKLSYAYDALEPHIDAATMEIHHTKHHQTYINNLNAAVEGTEFAEWPVEKLVASVQQLPEKLRAAVINQGGGHANHSLFWEVMVPNGGGKPDGALAKAIDEQLGGFDKFKEEFTKAATTQFGSGWAWLVADKASKKLALVKTGNADTPLSNPTVVPLAVLDVWEHAYYLDYENRRADYAAAVFDKLFCWRFVEKNLAAL